MGSDARIAQLKEVVMGAVSPGLDHLRGVQNMIYSC